NARTGELTPPGMRCCARVKSSDDREFKKKPSTLNVQRSTPKSEKLSRLSPRRASMDLRSALDTSAATTILFALAHRRGSQVVRSRSAKPLFAGSIPAPASFIGKNIGNPAEKWLSRNKFADISGGRGCALKSLSAMR